MALAVFGLLWLAAQAPAAAAEPSPALVAPALKVSATDSLPSTPAQRALAAKIGQRVVSLCPNCPLSTVTDGHCYWSHNARRIILNAVVRGATEAEIVAAYRATYGPQVLAWSTEGAAFTWSWLLPYIGAGLGLLVLAFVAHRSLRRRAADPAGGADPSASAPPAAAPAPTQADQDPSRAELDRALRDLD